MIEHVIAYISSKIVDSIPKWLLRTKYIRNLRHTKFSNNFWNIISENCCFIIPAHPKRRISTSTVSESNAELIKGTGYNDCIAVGKLSQYIYSIVKSQTPIYEVGKGDESRIRIWKEESDNDISFEYEGYDLTTELSTHLNENNYIIIGGPESNFISKILFDTYIDVGPKFEGHNIKLSENKTIIDSNNKDYGCVLLYYLSFKSNDTEIKKRIMMIAGRHGSDTRRVIKHLQNKGVIKKISSLLKKHDFNCCISLRYNNRTNLIEDIDKDIKDYQIEVKN